MANICENELRIYTVNKENKETIKHFFKGEWNEDIIEDEENITIYFDSKWTFPEEAMDRLYDSLPNKKDLNMICLSVEWGCAYCQFHTCDENGWYTE